MNDFEIPFLCYSNEGCWGDGVCDPVLNTDKHCHDGGDCSWKYTEEMKNKRKSCDDYDCCNGAISIMNTSISTFVGYFCLISCHFCFFIGLKQ